ncbi:hypothetical protein [Arthrobacter oryzae]|uniref:hypothetical protein n=1 Tax=Arthrobacter oryzae TaxID=409290 RepID=UPI00142E1824|nr:hypothetical protein [Arthrobacter oryzae]
MASCAECRARQQRERQYLERLRGAAVPEASEDLTARLLARTEQLAAERTDADPERTPRDPAGGLPAGPAAPGRAATDGPFADGPVPVARPQGGRRSGARGPVLAGAGAIAALALMAGTAYFMGGDAGIPADGAEGSALARPDSAGPLNTAGSLDAGEPLGAGELPGAAGGAGVPGNADAPRVGFGPGDGSDIAPAGALSAGQLTVLRAQGWTCPELRDLGFHLMWARAGVMSGVKVLELRLTDGRHFATVLEQHISPDQVHGTPPAQADASPINVLTGHTARADGFTPAPAGLLSSAPRPRNGALWINPAPPYRAIYQSAAGTYTYISDLPAVQAGDGAAALTRVRSEAPAPASRDGIPERIERGLSRILEHLAP